MNYQVILNEQVSIYVPNVSIVEYVEDTIIFRELTGNTVAAFKMYQIIGFYRVDVPVPEPKEYKWDFDMIDKYTKQQQEEAEEQKKKDREWKEERKAEAMETARKRITKEANRAARILQEYKYVYGEISDEVSEVAIEAMDRQTHPKGDNIHLFERKILKQLLKENMDKCIGGQ